MKGGSEYECGQNIICGGGKKSKTSNCHCGLPSCICRCARDVCPKNCRCMKCRRGRKSRGCRTTRCMVSGGGDCSATYTKLGGFSLDQPIGGGRRRGRPCKATRRKSTRRKRRKTLKTRY